MSYFQNPYCVTNFIVFDNYETITFDDITSTDLSYHQTMNQTINVYAFGKFEKDMPLSGKIKTVKANEESIIEYLKNNKAYFVYNPLEETKELFLELYKVKVFDETSLLKFVKNYGLPYNEFFNEDNTGIYNSDLFPSKPNERAFIGMDAFTFYERLVHFQGMVKLWNDIKENNIEELKKVKRSFEMDGNEADLYLKSLSNEEYIELTLMDARFSNENLVKRIINEIGDNRDLLNNLTTTASEHAKLWDQVKNSSLQDIAKAELSLRLNKVDSGHPTTHFDAKEGIAVPAFKFNNLMEVAYYQLSQVVYENSGFEKCLNCGKLFKPQHPRQKFCSPVGKRKRSTCENTYNQKRKRQKKREREEMDAALKAAKD